MCDGGSINGEGRIWIDALSTGKTGAMLFGCKVPDKIETQRRRRRRMSRIEEREREIER